MRNDTSNNECKAPVSMVQGIRAWSSVIRSPVVSLSRRKSQATELKKTVACRAYNAARASHRPAVMYSTIVHAGLSTGRLARVAVSHGTHHVSHS